MSEENIPNREKLRALWKVSKFNPPLSAGIICIGIFAAMLEGIGLGFILPILEVAREGGDNSSGTSTIIKAFTTVYETLGIPFTLEFIIVGVASVLTVRYVSRYVVGLLGIVLRTTYLEKLRRDVFERTITADVEFADTRGSDEVLNAVVTQTNYAARLIDPLIKIVEQTFITLVYFAITLYLAPKLTIATAIFLGVVTYLVRYVLEAGYTVGNRVARANERVQRLAQAAVQGVREVKLYNMESEVLDDFRETMGTFVDSTVRVRRNRLIIRNAYQLITALTVFVLVYLALRYTPMSLSGIALYLFAMFRLAPRVSTLNNLVYRMENDLPHLVRTQELIDELERHQEPESGSEAVPDAVGTVEFDDVTFSYGEETVLRDFSFEVDRGEFVAFVGQSGAGKSTVVSLLARMYEPDSGEIRASGTPIDEYDVNEWRSKVAVVQQNPYIFDRSLRENLTLARPDASEAEIERVSRISRIDEFVDELPNGFDTMLGEDGVKLSGGQKQRVAIARALLKDADLMILDEATSDLDTNLESEVQSAIESMDRNYTLVVIAHRLSTVINADCIYTVEDGRITESGSHGDLIERDGTYADLYARQSEVRVGEHRPE